MYFNDSVIVKIARSLANTVVSPSFSAGSPTDSGIKARYRNETGANGSNYGSQYNRDGDSINNTLSKAMNKHDVQPLHVYTNSIDKPRPQGFSNKMTKRGTTLSHLEDKRITHRPITRDGSYKLS
jgi:hypothetical protein